MNNITLETLQQILASGAGGHKGADGRVYQKEYGSYDYNSPESGGDGMPNGVGPVTGFSSVDPNALKSSRFIDEFGLDGAMTGRRKDTYTNPLADVAKWAALTFGAGALGGALGGVGGAAAGGVGAGQFGSLAALDTAAAASAAGGMSAADAALIASLGDGTFAAGAGGMGSAGTAAGAFNPITMSVDGVAPILAGDLPAMVGGDALLGTAASSAGMNALTMSNSGLTQAQLSMLQKAAPSVVSSLLKSGTAKTGATNANIPDWLKFAALGGSAAALAGGKTNANGTGSLTSMPPGNQYNMTLDKPPPVSRTYNKPPPGYRPGIDPEFNYFGGIGALGSKG